MPALATHVSWWHVNDGYAPQHRDGYEGARNCRDHPLKSAMWTRWAERHTPEALIAQALAQFGVRRESLHSIVARAYGLQVHQRLFQPYLRPKVTSSGCVASASKLCNAK